MSMANSDDNKQLKGSKDGNRRADIGEYRIVYRAENETLLVLVIGNAMMTRCTKSSID